MQSVVVIVASVYCFVLTAAELDSEKFDQQHTEQVSGGHINIIIAVGTQKRL